MVKDSGEDGSGNSVRQEIKKMPEKSVRGTELIAIIDYGLGNLGSIANMLRVVGEKSVITRDPQKIYSADRLILPGVGAFDTGMSNLEKDGLANAIRDAAAEGKAILGICLGMQLLGKKSEEGTKAGLSLIPFSCKKFDFSGLVRPDIPDNSLLKIPHMGWDVVDFTDRDDPLLARIVGRQRYYFVHSYYAVCENRDNILMTCDYGYSFAAAVVSGRIYGVQFHPEKSHDFGMRLLANFAKRV